MTSTTHIKGNKITLRSARPEDKKPIFEWLSKSNLTHKMFGPPTFSDCPIPDWEEFVEGYPDYFFNNSQPLLGRCFIIEAKGEAIGQINHDKLSGPYNQTELDIWLKDAKFTQKGYGTDAILTLCNYLTKVHNCMKFVIAPSRRNTAAVNSYEKVGFKETIDIPEDFIPDYDDAVYMIKQVNK